MFPPFLWPYFKNGKSFKIRPICLDNAPEIQQDFIDKANKAKEDYISFIAYYKDIPIGITGVYTEEIDKDSIFLYFRSETNYWKGRPAVSLYDKVMNVKEVYTAENKNADKPTLIYTYNFTDKSELWNNRYLGLNDYYDKCNE